MYWILCTYLNDFCKHFCCPPRNLLYIPDYIFPFNLPILSHSAVHLHVLYFLFSPTSHSRWQLSGVWISSTFFFLPGELFLAQFCSPPPSYV